MTTRTLATLYRANSFDQVVGQKLAVAQAKGMIKTGRIPSVLFITGLSGVGKTTLATLIAHALNNTDPKKPSSDVKDFNVGEDGGISTIRDIINFSKFSPQHKYRVIILDEAQRLSGASQSALLKVFENSPPQTLWILCTNEPGKVVDTMHGRSEIIALREPKPPELIPLLARICKAEKIKFSSNENKQQKIMLQIAEAAHGQPRLAISILQRVSNIVAGMGGDASKAFRQGLDQVLNLGNDRVATKILLTVYLGKPNALVQTLTEGTADHRSLLNMCLDFNEFLIQQKAGGQSYLSGQRQKLLNILKEKNKNELPDLAHMLKTHNTLTALQSEMSNFLVNPGHLMLAKLGILAVQIGETK